MVYVVVELANVSLKTKASPFLISHQCATHIKHTLVYSTTFNASIGILNEQVHPMLTQHVNHAMMNDSVGKEWRNHQFTLFRVVNLSFLVFAWYIRFISQHFIQLIQSLTDIVVKFVNLCSLTFSTLCVVLSLAQIFIRV